MEKIVIRKYTEKDVPAMCGIWNEVVEDGVAFPQEEALNGKTGSDFFASQTYCAVAEETESKKIAGLYILHPNNVGRCGHICNASYAVSRDVRGKGIGERLVRHCIATAKEIGFRILQFNAVVRTNKAALQLYQKLGFTQLGVIPGGFRLDDGRYEDIVPHYIVL